jgi:hypothetical protein
MGDTLLNGPPAEDDVLKQVMEEDVLLNGRRPLDWQLPSAWRALVRLRMQGREQLAGLLAEYPRDPAPVPRPVTDVLPVLR